MILIILAESSICDIKFRKVWLLPAVLAGIAMVLCEILSLITNSVSLRTGLRALADMIFGMTPGAVLYLFSKLSKGKIGEGDAFLLAVTGIGSGLINTLLVVCTGFALASVTAGILLILKKVRKDTGLPFVPFLLAGYLINILK